MCWQDLLMTLSGIIFMCAMIPQIIKNHKQGSAKEVSWLFLFLYVVALSISDIGLFGSGYWMSGCINIIIIGEYITIGIQKIYYNHLKNKLNMII